MEWTVRMKTQDRPREWSDQNLLTSYKNTTAVISVIGEECTIQLNGLEAEETFYLLWELLFLYDGYFFVPQEVVKNKVEEEPETMYRTPFYRTDKIWFSSSLLARSNRDLSTKAIEAYAFFRNQGKLQKKMIIWGINAVSTKDEIIIALSVD